MVRFNDSKGIANILELLAVVLALFVAFNMFFPGRGYKSNWDDAYAVLIGRDMISSLAATGDLYPYMSDQTKMDAFFEDLFPVSNYVFWYKMEGIRERINVACNCTGEQIQKLDTWADGLRVNGRDINMFFCYADLGAPGSTCMEDSDVLVIWGNKNLNEQTLSNYLVEGKGIIEIADFTAAEPPDAVQQSIFGIDSGGSYDGTGDDIVEPASTSKMGYGPYKLFYDMPLTLYATQTDYLAECASCMNGTLKLTNTHTFWTCNGTYVFFDTDGDGFKDTPPLQAGNVTTIGGFDFTLRYFDSMDRIRLTFSDSTPYKFGDFVQPAAGGQPVVPDDGDEDRILVQMDGTATPIACGVVLNSMYDSGTAWVADFGRNGLDPQEVGDDHRQLMLSLMLWSSKKATGSEGTPTIQTGYVTSYVEINNIDVFDIQKYEIGVGSPY